MPDWLPHNLDEMRNGRANRRPRAVRNLPHSSLRISHSSSRGFTLAELLVVIGIILLLISILVPTVARVRKAGQATDTKALISAIDGACQMYYQDHRKWPGPLSPNQLGETAANTNVTVRASAEFVGNGGNLENVTGTENLVLGLLGGLVLEGGEVVYDPSLVGNGPVKLGNTPGGYSAYLDVSPENLSMRETADGKTGNFVDDSGDALDSIVPEFTDRFSSPLPILYMRARPTGFTGSFTAANVAAAGSGTFDYNAIAGYVEDTGNGYIGVGKDPDNDYMGEDVIAHGLGLFSNLDGADAEDLRASKNKSSGNFTYPYDLRAALVSPSEAAARQNDRYVIISAGPDRIYGTRDDLTNFGEY